MIMSDIAKNIKRLRMDRGLSQAQLAEKLNVTRQTISSWERGNSYPDVGMLVQITEALNAEVNDLLYPAASRKRGLARIEPLSPGFVIWSVVIYFFLFTIGGVNFGVPLIRFIVGGNGQVGEILNFLCWGMILLVGYIAICVGLITEYLADTSRSDSKKQESD